MLPLNIGATSMRVQTWMLAWLRCEWSAEVASRQRWMLARLWCKWSVDMASVQMMVLLHSRCKYKYCFLAKMNVGMASIQGRMLAGFMVKTLNVATLQRLLRWLHWEDKCWCSLIAKTKANTTSMSSTSNSIIVSGIPMITLLPRWLPL